MDTRIKSGMISGALFFFACLFVYLVERFWGFKELVLFIIALWLWRWWKQ